MPRDRGASSDCEIQFARVLAPNPISTPRAIAIQEPPVISLFRCFQLRQRPIRLPVLRKRIVDDSIEAPKQINRQFGSRVARPVAMTSTQLKTDCSRDGAAQHRAQPFEIFRRVFARMFLVGIHDQQRIVGLWTMPLAMPDARSSGVEPRFQSIPPCRCEVDDDAFRHRAGLRDGLV